MEDSISVHLRIAVWQQSHDSIRRYSGLDLGDALLISFLINRRDLFLVPPFPLQVVSSAIFQLTEMDGGKASRSREILGQYG